ncbi:MAG TPA: LysR family transcriptional regulator [Acidimicrobiales bacterium]|nr:LysR family transcriptional regulator [Acidimicrobiales bacterium]
MELAQLRCVVAVADHGNFTKAAAALHFTQPSLSYSIGKLEAELGVLLFRRLARGVALTDAGAAVVEHARRAVDEADAARAAAAGVAEVMSGTLSLVSLRTYVGGFSRLVARFHERFPGVLVTLHDPEGDARVAELLRARVCELGVVRMVEPPGDLDVTRIGIEEAVVALPPGSELSSREFLSLEEVAQLTMVAPPKGNPIRTAFDLAFSRTGARPRIVAEAAHQETALALAQAGVGACLASRDNADLAGNGCTVLALEWPITVDLGLAHPRGRLSPAARAFKDLAIATVGAAAT